MATEVLQRAAIMQKAEEMRISSVKLATVQGFDVAAVINLIVHTSPKDTVQELIDDTQKLETEMLRAHYTIKLIETRPGVSGQSIFPLLQRVAPESIKQLSKESLSLILDSIPHAGASEASELGEIARCKETVLRQHAEISNTQSETQLALEKLETALEEARTNHWHMYAHELRELQSVIPPAALKKIQQGDIAEATTLLNRLTKELESSKISIHQDPESVALLQEDERNLERMIEDVERTWRDVSSYEERLVNASVGEIGNRLRNSMNDIVRLELSAALDAADQSIADVDAFLKESSNFKAALESATERAAASLRSDVTLRTEALLQSQGRQSSQISHTNPFATTRADWCKDFDCSFEPIAVPIEEELLDKHQQFMEAYEQAQQSIRPVTVKFGREKSTNASGFASFEQVVQAEFARLDADLDGIRSATLQVLQERPTQYTDTLSTRVKEIQIKADEILNRMHNHMVESMINSSKDHANQYVQECRANIQASTPRHTNWSLVDELTALDDDMLLDKAHELLAKARSAPQQRMSSIFADVERRAAHSQQLEHQPQGSTAPSMRTPTNPAANARSPRTGTLSTEEDRSSVEKQVHEKSAHQKPKEVTNNKPARPREANGEDDVVVAKVPFQFGNAATADVSGTQQQSANSENSQQKFPPGKQVETSPAVDLTEPTNQREHLHKDISGEESQPQGGQKEIKAETDSAQPAAQPPPSPPPGPVFRPSLFKSNLFKTIDK